MESRLPLSALLSQAYVAFAIEFDNEFEHQAPHRTTNYGSTPGAGRAPWLVSMAIWIRIMQHVPVEGITLAELQPQLAMSNRSLKTWLTRLGRWWGYLRIVEADPESGEKRIGPKAILGPTSGGRRAIEVWRTLIPTVEARWRERFGNQAIALESGLRDLAGRLDPDVPGYIPVMEHEDEKSRRARMRLRERELTLPELLAKALFAFALEFDAQSAASLAVCANVLRVTPDAGVLVRELAGLSYLSRKGVDDALRQLGHEGLGVVRTERRGGGRAKMLVLTPRGLPARDHYATLAGSIEMEWKKRFGDTVNQVRAALEGMAQGDGAASTLLDGVAPYPDGWRAQLPPIEGLPHFPMVSHRGGFPDGS